LDIILASTSKIRRNVLTNAGIKFSAVDSEINETAARVTMHELSVEKTARELAKLKSIKVSGHFPDAIVIGADQILGFQNKIFNKPASRAEAEIQLLKLRGNTHTLYSAISCAVAGSEIWSHCSEAHLTMRNFTPEFLLTYLNDNPESYLTSVGGYKLEESGIQLFDKIDGDYFAILGLPLLPLLGFLRQQEVVQP
jgi:septum formation protein